MQRVIEASCVTTRLRLFGYALALIAALLMLATTSHQAAHALHHGHDHKPHHEHEHYHGHHHDNGHDHHHDHEEHENEHETCVACVVGTLAAAQIVPHEPDFATVHVFTYAGDAHFVAEPPAATGLHLIRSRSPPFSFS